MSEDFDERYQPHRSNKFSTLHENKHRENYAQEPNSQPAEKKIKQHIKKKKKKKGINIGQGEKGEIF